MSLVLNVSTGLVSPQYHVKHDNLFETIKRQARIDYQWQNKCHFTREKEEDARPQGSKQRENNEASTPLSERPEADAELKEPEEDVVSQTSQNQPNDDDEQSESSEPDEMQEDQDILEQSEEDTLTPVVGQTRSGRNVRRSQRLHGYSYQATEEQEAFLAQLLDETCEEDH